MTLFQGKALSLFGIQIPKIIESLNVELQDIKVQEWRTDLVFLLEDDSLLHLEFQTTFSKDHLTRFLMYDLLLHEQHKHRKITTIIIYASGVKQRELSLNFETLKYTPYLIFLEEIDGDEILYQLEEKVKMKVPFNDEDFLHILFNFLMKNGILDLEERAK